MVTNTPGVLTEDTADMTMALILSVPRRLAEGEKLVRSGQWQGWSPTGMLGHRIGGKALGIIGMGRIGQAIARRARRSEEHTSELQSLMRISYAVFCLKKKKRTT